MTKDSKERVKRQKLEPIRQAESRLLSPLPAKLKRVAQASAFTAVGKKMQQLPGFVDFQPLESLGRDALPAREESAQAQTGAEVKHRMIGALRDKQAREKNEPGAARHRLVEVDKKAQASKPQADRKTTSSQHAAKLEAARRDARATAKPAAAQKQKSAVAKFEPGFEPPPEKTGSIASRQASPRESGPRTLAILLARIADLNRSLEAPLGETVAALAGDAAQNVSTSVTAVAGDEAQNVSTSVEAEQRNKTKNPALARDKHKAGSATTRHEKAKSAALKAKESPAPRLDATSRQRPMQARTASAAAAAPGEDADLLRDLIAALWQRRDTTATSTSAAAQGDRRPAIPSGPEAITPARAASGVRIAELDVATVEAPTGPAERQQTPSLNQAEELAEQINRVIREQAWLRGVNLP